MRLSIMIFVVALMVSSGFLSCSTKTDSVDEKKLDTARLIEFGIDYIYKNYELASPFYLKPIMLVQSPFIPKGIRFIICGKYSTIDTRVVDGFEKSAYFSPTEAPQPYFEIFRLNLSKDGTSIEMNIHLPSVGSLYMFKIKRSMGEKFEVKSVEDAKT